MKIIDLTGKKHGDFTIVGRVKTEKDKYHKWICQCKCGNNRIYGSHYIRNVWKEADCGCSKSLKGKRFGKLIALEKIGIKSNTISNYICLCDCGNKKNIRGKYLLDGKIKSCGCAMVHNTKDIGPTIVKNTYRQHARKRNLEFLLNKEQVKDLILSPCYYCGRIESNKTRIRKAKNSEQRVFLHNGIDRMDNLKGYTIENSVSCCAICNMMKREMSIKEWTDQMILILSNLNKNA